jgi:endonuclease/exonuclease/phosphatase family metal-dependent hydrolase
MTRSPSPRGELRPVPKLVLTAGAIAAPWLWFVVRRVGGALDIVAVGLPLIGVLGLVVLGAVAAIRRRLLPLLVALSIFVVCAAATIAPRIPRHEPAPAIPIRIAMANVYDDNPTLDAAAATMMGRDVDVLAAVEIRPHEWDPLTRASSLPYHLSDGEMAVRSRYPVTLLSPGGLPRSRVLRVNVDAPGAPFILYLVHGLNPFHDSSSFSDQLAFVQSIADLAAIELEPVVVIGDFNMSDRSENYRVMDTAFLDAMREGNVAASTYFGGLWPLLMVRIDHAFVSRSWCAQDGSTFTVPGSDHHGIQVTVGPCP